jgi:predicted outer membrane repeat protein
MTKGSNNHVIDANNLGGIFKISPGITVYLNSLTFVNGNSAEGGAIYNEGDLIIED